MYARTADSPSIGVLVALLDFVYQLFPTKFYHHAT